MVVDIDLLLFTITYYKHIVITFTDKASTTLERGGGGKLISITWIIHFTEDVALKTEARILDGWLSSINWLFKSVDYNKREISVIQRVQ